MGPQETKLWGDSGSRGSDFRREVKRRLQAIADKRGKTIELYASARDGGWTAEVFQPEGRGYR